MTQELHTVLLGWNLATLPVVLKVRWFAKPPAFGHTAPRGRERIETASHGRRRKENADVRRVSRRRGAGALRAGEVRGIRAPSAFGRADTPSAKRASPPTWFKLAGFASGTLAIPVALAARRHLMRPALRTDWTLPPTCAIDVAAPVDPDRLRHPRS